MTKKAAANKTAAAPAAKSFASRIVRTGSMRARDIKANPLNFRRHPENQRVAVRAVLEQLGWIDNAIINEKTGNLLNGHLRVELACERDEEIPVVWVKLTEAEERVALAALDPTAQMAVTDDEALADLLAGCAIDSDNLRSMLDALLVDVQAESPKPIALTPAAPKRGRQLDTNKLAQIRPVFFAKDIATMEDAIRRTGIQNRGRALMAIFEFFIESDQTAGS